MPIAVEREDGVAVVTVDRQDALNALDLPTLTELRDRLDELADDESVRAVVLTGAGEKAFVAGVFGPGAPTGEIVDFIRGAVGTAA